MSLSGVAISPFVTHDIFELDQMYASENHQAELKYQKTVCTAVQLKTLERKPAAGEEWVGLPIDNVASCMMKMKKFEMENSRVLMPAGPNGNHHQMKPVHLLALVNA